MLSKFSSFAIDHWFVQTSYYNKSMINLAKTTRRTSLPRAHEAAINFVLGAPRQILALF